MNIKYLAFWLRRPVFVACTLFLWLSSIDFSFGQKLPVGPQVLTFFSDADDTEQPYALYLPKNYNEKKKYPLVVMLHGAGSNHRLALRRVFGKSNANGETDVEATLYFPGWEDVPYIVAAPYARGTAGYQGFVEKDVYDVLADVKRRFKIDENRTYLTGLSMGGGGTLWLGLTRPDIWAAIAPVCPASPKGTLDLLPNALNLPIHFFHGDADPAVPVAGTRDMVKQLKEMGTAVEYTEYPGVQHNSWEKAYEGEFIFKWFEQFHRNPFPDRVRFVSAAYNYNQAYWVQLDQLTPGTLVHLDARFTGPNQVEVTTAETAGFTLNLDGHAKFKAGKPTLVTIDGEKLVVPAKAGELSFSKQAGHWTTKRYAPAAGTKQPDAEGPISAVFARRHIYVYGTMDNPSQEVLKARMDTAQVAADWSADRGWFLGRIKFYPRVISDKDVRPSDLASSNLVLFGTKETNSLIAQYSDRLPVALDATATGNFGLFYVFPIDGHYVAVSSGLPWWTGAELSGWRFLPPAQMLLAGYKDFVFFKGSAKTVLAEGYFDNNWQLPDWAVQAFKSAGVVRLK